MIPVLSISNVRTVGSCVLCALFCALAVGRVTTSRSVCSETGACATVGFRHAASTVNLPAGWIRFGSLQEHAADEQRIDDLSVASIGATAKRIELNQVWEGSSRLTFQADPVSLFCLFCAYRL